MPGEIDAHRDRAAAEIGARRIDQLLARVKGGERVAVELGRAAAEADLREARSAPHQNGKSTRTHFEIERSFVARRQRVKRSDAVADDAREHVETAGRAFRIGRRGEIGRKFQPLFQLDEIDAARLEYRAGV